MLFKNQENVKYHLTIDDETRVKIVNGNSKLGRGIYAVNLLPGDTPLTLKDGTQLTNVAGSCAGCCSGCKTDCYAVSDAKRYHNTVIKSQGNNTLLARFDRERFFEDVQRFIDYNMIAALRIHSSGEFLSYGYFTDWIDFVKKNPETKFYFMVPPYSSLWWYEAYMCGDLELNYYALDQAFTRLLEYDNVEIHYFQGMEEIVSDLSLFMDTIHYHPDVNKTLVELIPSCKYKITLDTKDEVLNIYHLQFFLYFSQNHLKHLFII